MKIESKIVNKITTIIAFSLLCFFMLTIFLRVITRVGVKLGLPNNKFVQFVFFDDTARQNWEESIQKINWQEQYPFEDSRVETKDIGFVDKVISKTKSVEEEISKWTSETLIFRMPLIEIGNKIENILDWNLVPTKGALPTEIEENYFVAFSQKNDNLKEPISSLCGFSEYCKNNNTPFLYVQVPSRVCREDSKLNNIYDYSNANMDMGIKGLLDNDIHVLDMRKELHNEGLNHHDIFYETDHHWKAETGLWATGKIIEYLNKKFNFHLNTSVVEPNRFYFINYENNFLGSYGRKVSLSKANLEDITLIKPKDAYNLEYKRYRKDALVQNDKGNFDILIDYNQLRDGDYYSKSSYAAYMHSDNISFIKNNSSDNDYKIMIIGSSYTNVVEPYLALSVKQLDCIDLRHYNGSLLGFINKNGPYDCIIYLQGEMPNHINYSSHGDLYDFR